MSEGRDIYHEPKQKVLLRTADVYQTEVDDEVAGYSDKLLAIVADYHNGGRPEGMNAQAMGGKVGFLSNEHTERRANRL